MPYVNEEACRKALKAALTLNCEIPDELVFDRKNYFYPDLPKGFQITQYKNQWVKMVILNFLLMMKKKKVNIRQIHLEEDTASLEHRTNYSLINYNRSGVPLIEIVTEPCLYSAEETVAFLETLRNLFLYCEISEADTRKGQMRCDVNISLMKETDTDFGTKVEMKTLTLLVVLKLLLNMK